MTEKQKVIQRASNNTYNAICSLKEAVDTLTEAKGPARLINKLIKAKSLCYEVDDKFSEIMNRG